MKKFFMVALAAMAMTAMQASAAFVYGTVGFAGLVNTPITTSNMTVTFTSLAPMGDVLTSSGGLALAAGTDVTANFAAITAANINTWVLTFGAGAGSYTFTASSLVGGLVSGTNGIAISTNLLGTYTKAGFDPSPGTLRISYQTPQPGSPDTYSASGSSVPEPGTYALLGSALLGLGLLRRKA